MALLTHRPSFTTLGTNKTIKKLLRQPQASLHMLVVEQELCHMLALLAQSEQGVLMFCITDQMSPLIPSCLSLCKYTHVHVPQAAQA